MEKYNVEFEVKTFITIEVMANDEETAKENAAVSIDITSLSPRQGFGSTLAIKGENNSIFLEVDNAYECVTDVTKL